MSSLLSTICRRVFWKRVYQYQHESDEETVELHRHRLTGRTRRIWYNGLWYDGGD